MTCARVRRRDRVYVCGRVSTVACVLLICVLFAAAQARADEPLSLQWTAPEACPGEEQVLAQVRAMLGEGWQPSSPDTRLVVKARVTVSADQVASATLQFSGGETGAARRVLQGEDCAAVTRASALVIAIALDPTAALRASEPPEQSPPPPPASTPPATEDAAPPAREPSPTSFGIGVAFVLGSGLLPFLAPGVEGTLFVDVDALRIEIDGVVAPPQDQATSQTALVRTRLGLYGAGVRGGYVLRSGPWSLAALVGVAWISVAGEARGPNRLALVPREAADAFLAPEIGVLGELGLTRWAAMRLFGRALVPLSRRSFLIENLGPVHRADAISLVAGIGACVRL